MTTGLPTMRAKGLTDSPIPLFLRIYAVVDCVAGFDPFFDK